MNKKAPFQLTVNQVYPFEIDPETARTMEVLFPEHGTAHIIMGEKSRHFELISSDYNRRRYVFRLDGNKYEVEIADQYDRLIKALGFQTGTSQKMNLVKAPMPGLVLQIPVKPGDSVQKGDTLLILEAMKMENILKAAGDGVVKKVHVSPGNAVDKGQLLVEME